MSILDTTVIGPLAAGASFTYTYPDKITAPDLVLPLLVTPIKVVGSTRTQVVFQNTGAATAPAAAFWLAWFYGEVTRDVGLATLGWQGGDVVAPDTTVVTAGDANTILDADLYSKAWQQIFPSNTVGLTPAHEAYTDVAGNARFDGIRINRQQNEAAGDRIAMQFVAPPGCTSVVLSLAAMLPATITGQTIVIGVYQVDGVTAIQTLACVLTASMQTFAVPAATVVAGTEYRVVIKIHETGAGTTANATALIDPTSVKLTPSGALAAPFNAPFTRFGTNPSRVHDSRVATFVSRKIEVSGFARRVFRTRGTIIAIEYIRTYAFATVDVAVFVDGKCVGAIPLTGNNVLNIATMALPPGLKTVEVIWPPENNSATPPAAPNISTAYLNAIYFPTDTSLAEVAPSDARGGRRLGIYGDSTPCGFGCATPGAQGLVSVLRRDFPGAVLLEAWGSRSLAEDCCTAAAIPFVAADAATAASVAKQVAFAKKIAQLNLTDIWWCIGTNDYGGGYWTAVTDYSACMGATLDLLNTYCPGARIWVQTPLRRAVETANARGWTMAQLRTEITAVASAKSYIGAAQVIDGNAILGSAATGINGLLGDTVHPNGNGSAQWAENIRIFVGY